MKIAISGASGFIGTHLTELFSAAGHGVVALDIPIFRDENKELLIDALSGCEVVINLAGAPINHRWSKKYKEVLRSSRIHTTRRIVETINSLEIKPKLLISTSAVGYYPASGCYDEYSSVLGNGFLAELCQQWEAESQKVDPKVRLVNTRFGVVLAQKGGAFGKMIQSTKFGVATIVASGRQYFSWISLQDHGRAMEHIVNSADVRGVVNLVAPTQITNREFTRLVARHYRSFLTIRIPRLFFQMTMGQSSQFVVDGQCVKPTKLTESGFKFSVPTINDFLDM